MTTAASPPGAERKWKIDSRHLEQGVKIARQGASEASLLQHARLHWGVETEEDFAPYREAIDMVFAKRGESLDPLAWAMRRIANREVIIEKMMWKMNREDLPASHFAVLRHLLNDSDRAVKDLCELREKEGRDVHTQNRQAEANRAEAIRQADVHFASQKMYENAGYGYVPALDMLQPGIDLNREEAAARDIFRMRMMPKSPREDAILLEIAGLNETIRDSKLDPMELSDKKIYPSFRYFNPKDYVDDECAQHAGTGHYRDDAHFNRVIKAERIQHYNETWSRANDLVDDIMDAFDIRLGFVHETVGIPKKVQLALDGDKEAIAFLKEEVAKIKQLRAERVARGEKERPNPILSKRVSGMITDYVPMFLAMVMGWLIASMFLGQTAMNQLQAAVAQQEIPAQRASEGTPRGMVTVEKEEVSHPSPRWGEGPGVRGSSIVLNHVSEYVITSRDMPSLARRAGRQEDGTRFNTSVAPSPPTPLPGGERGDWAHSHLPFIPCISVVFRSSA